MTELKNLKVSSSPHIRNEDSTRQIMLDVVIALLPALAVAVFVFGARSLVMTVVSVLGCVFFEWLYNKLLKKPMTITDGSAVVTGMLLAYTLPVTAPYWVVLIGDFFAIVIVKCLYGGIGQNFINPALGGRAFLMASWPVAMTTWCKVQTSLPLFTTPEIQSAATPLTFLKEGNLPNVSLQNAALGMVGGSMGEISALALLTKSLQLFHNFPRNIFRGHHLIRDVLNPLLIHRLKLNTHHQPNQNHNPYTNHYNPSPHISTPIYIHFIPLHTFTHTPLSYKYVTIFFL